MKTVKDIRLAIDNEKARSAWDKGVKVYALEILGDMDENTELCGSPEDRKTLLNGANNWNQFSEGGCSLIYDGDIAQRLCSPSELKRTRDGEREPNASESWIDVQARALHQAAKMILRLSK